MNLKNSFILPVNRVPCGSRSCCTSWNCPISLRCRWPPWPSRRHLRKYMKIPVRVQNIRTWNSSCHVWHNNALQIEIVQQFGSDFKLSSTIFFAKSHPSSWIIHQLSNKFSKSIAESGDEKKVSCVRYISRPWSRSVLIRLVFSALAKKKLKSGRCL